MGVRVHAKACTTLPDMWQVIKVSSYYYYNHWCGWCYYHWKDNQEKKVKTPKRKKNGSCHIQSKGLGQAPSASSCVKWDEATCPLLLLTGPCWRPQESIFSQRTQSRKKKKIKSRVLKKSQDSYVRRKTMVNSPLASDARYHTGSLAPAGGSEPRGKYLTSLFPIILKAIPKCWEIQQPKGTTGSLGAPRGHTGETDLSCILFQLSTSEWSDFQALFFYYVLQSFLSPQY